VRRRGSRSTVLLLAAALCAATPAAAQQPIPYDSVSALRAPPPDRRIAYGSGPLQFGNLRLPKARGPFPVVLLIHGGCFLSEYSISHLQALEQALADSGFAVWSIEYRKVGDDGGGWPGTWDDVGRAADYLRTLAKQYPLDLRRVVAVGHSAGGTLALWLPTRRQLPSGSPLRSAQPIEIRGVLALAPAADLETLHTQGVCNNVIDKLIGGSPASVPERYRQVSPMLLMPIGVPQIIVVGAQDARWGPGGRAYNARAVATKDPLVRFVDVPTAGHFDVIAPTTGTWPIVMQSLRDLYRRIGQ